jgi:hypothetical protein
LRNLVTTIKHAAILLLLTSCLPQSPATSSPPSVVIPTMILTVEGTMPAAATDDLSELVTPIPTETPAAPTFTPVPFWQDHITIMNGICFESAYDAREQVFTFRSDAELANFYNLADNSQLCRQPVGRGTFDFAEGRALAGLWSYGIGCTAHHEFVSFNRDDPNRAIDVVVRFVTDGECSYELIRPFWIGLDNAAGYQISIRVEPEAPPA